jgi:hypothetical protein
MPKPNDLCLHRIPMHGSGVLECKDFGPVAKQIVPWYPDSVQNEKELFSVNVWTQGINDGKKRPVCSGCMAVVFTLAPATTP